MTTPTYTQAHTYAIGIVEEARDAMLIMAEAAQFAADRAAVLAGEAVWFSDWLKGEQADDKDRREEINFARYGY